MADDFSVAGSMGRTRVMGRGGAGRRAPSEGGALAVQQAILRAFAATGHAPAMAAMEEASRPFGVTARHVLAKLADADFIGMNEDEDILTAYPFSGVPTPHRVQLSTGSEVFAMCAIDALGIPPMLGCDAVILSADPLTEAPITVSVSGKQVEADPGSAVVYLGRCGREGPSVAVTCGYLNFFESHAAAEAWSSRNPQVTGMVVTLAEAAAIGGDIFGELLAAPDDVGNGAKPVGPEEILLATDSVTKSFRRTVALRDISLSVRRGEVVAIVGENGAGKSTFLRICAGLETPDRGTVRRSAGMGYCPQEPGLFDLLTADEHVALFCGTRSRDNGTLVSHGRALLQEFGFRPRSQTLARDLSGGERQKLNLTLALLGGPDLLLLDEPYQGFDYGSYLDFWRLVGSWRAEGKAVVMVTHLLTELHRVDRIIELRRVDTNG